jgi:hypothetical protein
VWLGLLVLLALLAPLCATAALVLARNHWLAVALRYVLGVLLSRSGAGLRLRCLAPFRPLQRAAALAALAALALVGGLVSLYLATCYSVRPSGLQGRGRCRGRARQRAGCVQGSRQPPRTPLTPLPCGPRPARQVTALLSVPVLDVTLALASLPGVRRHVLRPDLVFLECYRQVGVTG